MEVADRVVVMNGGRIEQQGTPEELYEEPASPFVLNFLGDVHAWDDGFVRPGDLAVQVEPAGDTRPAIFGHALTLGSHARLAFRRDDAGAPAGSPPEGAAEGAAEGTAEGTGWIEVELPRDEYLALRERGALQAGARLHLRARRLTRFASA
jgi:sulfate transport system ATP-binding protein